MAELSVIGKNIPRVDAMEKVTGRAEFLTDMNLPSMLHCKLLRSPLAHAKIKHIDCSKAIELPGVRAVITGKDVPERRYGVVLLDKHVLVKEKVRCAGEPVAAVAADTIDLAEKALEEIEVEYEELPAILDMEESLNPDNPVILHPDLPNYEAFHLGIQLEPDLPNVHNHFKIRKGDVEKGFQEADIVIENRFETPRTQHCAIEPHVAIVNPEADGGITVWTTTQGIYLAQKLISDMFEIPVSKARVTTPLMGGGFGLKAVASMELIAVSLALTTRQPVKLSFNREEEFFEKHVIPAVTYIKDGVNKNGTLIAREMKVILDGGAYGTMSAQLAPVGSHGAIGSYRIPYFKWDSYAVYTNRPIASAIRSVTNDKVQWAIESQMDIIAREIGLDPVEFRCKNILKEGEANLQGEIVHSIGAEACLEKASTAIALNKKPEAGTGSWRQGKGIAMCNMYSTAPIASFATIKVHPDAIIELLVSTIEMGQGCNTAFSQMVAEEFGTSLDNIKLAYPDTAVTPYDYITSSSHGVYITGNAIRSACQDAKKQMFELSSTKMDVSPDDLEIKEGTIYVKGSPDTSIHIKDLFNLGPTGAYLPGQSSIIGSEIVGRGICEPAWAPPNPETGLIDPELAQKGLRRVTHRTYGAQAAEVAVDIETGEVRVTKFSSCFDIVPINPKMVEQQIEGGVMMGMGNALFEEQKMIDGVVMNPNFTDYKVPTVGEMPDLQEFKSMLVPTPHKDGPYGAKGIGEAVLVPTAPAIANAIYDAVGVRIKDIPITAEKLLGALKKKPNPNLQEGMQDEI